MVCGDKENPSGWFEVNAPQVVHALIFAEQAHSACLRQRGRVQGPPATLAAGRTESQLPEAHHAKPGLRTWEQTVSMNAELGRKAVVAGNKEGSRTRLAVSVRSLKVWLAVQECSGGRARWVTLVEQPQAASEVCGKRGPIVGELRSWRH